jgi:hypothetical protein
LPQGVARGYLSQACWIPRLVTAVIRWHRYWPFDCGVAVKAEGAHGQHHAIKLPQPTDYAHYKHKPALDILLLSTTRLISATLLLICRSFATYSLKRTTSINQLHLTHTFTFCSPIFQTAWAFPTLANHHEGLCFSSRSRRRYCGCCPNSRSSTA